MQANRVETSGHGAFRVCGVRIDGLTLNAAADRILDLAADGGSHGVHLCNAYVLSLAAKDRDYAALLSRGDLNLPDGAPVAMVGRQMGFSSLTGRASGPDLMLETIRRGVARGTRHYLYGSTPIVAEKLEAQLHHLAPGVKITGVEAPPFRSLTVEEERELVDRLNDSGADVVWIGIGTPKQDRLVDRLQGEVNAVLVPVGAAFDFIAGTKARAPKWMRRANLEWVYRLLQEPGRLWKRYLVGNLRFLIGAWRDHAVVPRSGPVEATADERELDPVDFEVLSPSRWRSRLGRMLLAIDMLIIALSTALAFAFRNAIGESGALGPQVVEIPAVVAVLPLWLLILNLFGCHSPHYQNQGGEAFRRFLGGTTVAVMVLGFLSFLLDLNLSRVFVGVLFGLVLLLGSGTRVLVRHRLGRERGRGRLIQSVLVAGTDEEAIEVVHAMEYDRGLGYRVIGFLDDDRPAGTTVTDSLEVLGRTGDVLQIALDRGAGLVLVSPTGVEAGTLKDITIRLEGSPVDLAVAPSLFEVMTRRVAVESVGNVAILHIDQMRLSGWRAAAKLFLDMLGALLLAILSLPIFLAASLAIKLQRDGAPVLFKQTRVGRDGETFTLYKFRTMVPHAEEQKEELTELNEAGHIFFKIREDPRVTRVGRFLRRWSIDELPQLVNVLKGEMSLVGPRPPVPEEVEKYEPWHLRRLRVKPGITGVWQTSGRSNVPFDEAVRMDLFYIENWSLGYDLFLLGKTVLAVLGRTGAY